MRTLPKLLLGLAAVAVMAACGAARSRPVDASESATIAVDNRAFSDMTVYVAETVGSRRRLGLATGVSTTVFTIPSTVVGNGRELSFIVDPVGSSRTAISNTLFVQPGQRVTLTIPPS